MKPIFQLYIEWLFPQEGGLKYKLTYYHSQLKIKGVLNRNKLL
ncbi:MAG: hypothetical protein WC756_19405 [Taibaiella sp.]